MTAHFHQKHFIFFLTISFSFSPSFVTAEVLRIVSSGITHTNNLEIQETSNTNANTNLVRIGLETGLSVAKQSLDASGGYILQSNFIFNKDLSDSNDIKKISISASKLSSVNSSWLMRNTVSFKQYDNQALLINSYKGFSVGSTLGYLSKRGGGTDISFQLRKERHDKVESDRYSILRSKLDLTHYFSHKKKSPYWSIQASLAKNDANENIRDYFSSSFGLKYNKFQLASFTGNIGLYWQNDKYANATVQGNTTNVPLGDAPFNNESYNNNTTNLMDNGGKINSLPRIADIYTLSFQLSKPLSKSTSLYLGASLGQYLSSTSNKDEDFYSISSKFSWRF